MQLQVVGVLCSQNEREGHDAFSRHTVHGACGLFRSPFRGTVLWSVLRDTSEEVHDDGCVLLTSLSSMWVGRFDVFGYVFDAACGSFIRECVAEWGHPPVDHSRPVKC